MPKYTVFFDESGDEHIKVFAGFVSANEQWDRFELEWRRVLGRFNAPPLHMRTFAHSIGEFAEWKGDEPRRQAFFDGCGPQKLRACRNSSKQVPRMDKESGCSAQFD